jgi:uncharacterized protein (DUF486 family)
VARTKTFLMWFYLLINYYMWPMKLVWWCVTGTPPGNHMGIKMRNCKHLETLLFLYTYRAFLLFIIYLYQQINNLETLFNAACLNLSIILVFNLKNCSISEMGRMVLFLIWRNFCSLSLVLERVLRVAVLGVCQGSNFSTWSTILKCYVHYIKN